MAKQTLADIGIDLSKVANDKALEAKDDGAVDMIKAAKKEAYKKREGRFSFVKPELIPLPSKGRLYQNCEDEEVRAGFIRLYPMTLAEEEILTTQKFLKTGIATRMVFDNCIASNIDASDILTFDSTYLLYRLRQISYGDDYTINLKCPSTSCEKDFKETIKISDLSFEELPDAVNEPIIVTLPITKYKVTLILPRVLHSEKLYMKQKESEENNSRLLNLLVTTISIQDEKGKEVNPKDWEEFYKAIPGGDRAELTQATRYDTGIDKIKCICPHCGETWKETVPIGAEFFRL